MATTISTQDIIDAKRDIEDIGKAVNENVIVSPRYGEDFKSLPMIADEFQTAINTIVVNDGVPAIAVSDASGKTQQQINNEQAVLNTNQSNKNSLTVDILDFIPKSEWANIIQKTYNYECYDALVSAGSSSEGNVNISKAGKYVFKTAYSGTTNLNINMSENVELDFTQVAAGTVPLSNTGSLTKLTNTFSNISRFSRSLVFTSTTGLSAGDWICFYNPTEYSYSLWRPYYREGEWKKISKIVGNTVYFESAFYSDYIAANMELYKLNSVTSKIKGGKITCKNSTPTAVVKFSLSSDASDTDVEFDAVAYSSLEYDRCVSPRTFNPNCYNFGVGMDDYGYLNSNSFDYKVFGGSAYAKRHAIALGGGSDLCSVPVYNFRCYDSILTNDPTVDVGAADMHGNVAHSSYERCQIFGAAGIAGGDECYYKNCEIYGDVDGVTGYCAEIKGGSFGWIDCNYHVNKNPQSPKSRGIIDIGGASPVISSKSVKDCDIQVSGKVFSAAATDATTSFVKIINRGSSVNINPKISGVEFLTSQDIGNVLFISNDSGIDKSTGIIVENISGKMPVSYICRLGVGYLNAPMRMQKQSGKTTISSIAGTQIITGNINFPFSYPKLPEVQQHIRGINGATKSSFGGQQVVSLGVYSQNNASYRSTISTPTAMTAGDSVELVYCIGLNEC